MFGGNQCYFYNAVDAEGAVSSRRSVSSHIISDGDPVVHWSGMKKKPESEGIFGS